jgi:hypothetical protein
LGPIDPIPFESENERKLKKDKAANLNRESNRWGRRGFRERQNRFLALKHFD